MADETKQEAAPVDLTAARARHAAATRGPWRWSGSTRTRDVHLATTHSGHAFVLGFERWGFNGGQPSFQVYAKPEHHTEAPGSGLIYKLSELAEGDDKRPDLPPKGPIFRHDATHRKCQGGRGEFYGIAHPDATLIERCWEDLRDAFAEVDRLAGWNLALRTRLEQLARTALKTYEELYRVTVFDGLSVEGSESLALVGLYDKLDEGGDLLGPFIPPSEADGLRWKVAAAERSASEEKARADRLAAENAALRSKPFEADGLPPANELYAAFREAERAAVKRGASLTPAADDGVDAAVAIATERLRCRLGALAFDLEVLAAEGGSAADLVEKMRARGHLP